MFCSFGEYWRQTFWEGLNNTQTRVVWCTINVNFDFQKSAFRGLFLKIDTDLWSIPKLTQLVSSPCQVTTAFLQALRKKSVISPKFIKPEAVFICSKAGSRRSAARKACLWLDGILSNLISRESAVDFAFLFENPVPHPTLPHPNSPSFVTRPIGVNDLGADKALISLLGERSTL